MRRFLTTGLTALALVALAALATTALVGRSAAAASQYQYQGKPNLASSVVDVASGGYTIRVAGTGYSGSQPGGQLQLTCGGKKGAPCGPTPAPWPAGPVDAAGGFSFDFHFDCLSNVKSALAVGSDGTKSNSVKGAC